MNTAINIKATALAATLLAVFAGWSAPSQAAPMTISPSACVEDSNSVICPIVRTKATKRKLRSVELHAIRGDSNSLRASCTLIYSARDGSFGGFYVRSEPVSGAGNITMRWNNVRVSAHGNAEIYCDKSNGSLTPKNLWYNE